MRAALGLAAVVVALLAVPQVAPPFWVFVAIEVCVFALYALSLNLLLGYGGMLSFGHAAYFGIGAYAVGLLVKKTGAPLSLAFVAAPFAAAAAAAVVGFFCVRLTGIYFAMLTFAFQMLAYTVVLKSYALTGGDDGLSGIRATGILAGAVGYYYFTAAVVGVAVLALHRVVNSPFGYALRAIRANSTRARCVGLNVIAYRWLTFVVSGFFAGLAGALFAFATGSVFPGWLNWTASAVPVIMAVLGGIQTFVGPLIGALVYVSLETTITGFTEYWPLVMGVILVFLVLVLPDGLARLRLRRG